MTFEERPSEVVDAALAGSFGHSIDSLQVRFGTLWRLQENENASRRLVKDFIKTYNAEPPLRGIAPAEGRTRKRTAPPSNGCGCSDFNDMQWMTEEGPK